ncbi:MAG: RagB/SusD family nutrient uptake outer membrane protein [Bacteroidales bacterium]|nr:RagB/SusD family nutrient uptake outer membrane protein [Bacteroidales bacterium]MDY6170056.1 RagB/SusD family nutrient uptake outer membrane protein [Candidatus Cryptobacteroides sp.]
MSKIHITSLATALLMLTACSFLDPLPDGSYNNENMEDHVKLLRGYVDKIYCDLLPVHYANQYNLGLSAATDDALYRVETTSWRKFSNGTALMSENPFESLWNTSYKAINYANLFLEDNVGYNTRYILDEASDKAYRSFLQGSAYGFRAWFHFCLLKAFAGKGTDGRMLGVPLMTQPSKIEDMDYSTIVRATLDETVRQIRKDCDSAYFYLPYSNRDYPSDPQDNITPSGSALYKGLDKVAIDALRAEVFLFWASPAFNAEGDMERYDSAAFYASRVIRHKIEKEGALPGGFSVTKKFGWYECNSPEIIWASRHSTAADTEKCCYPKNFGGTANIVPTQELVDAFPMSNGYPISDPLSGYDPANPYLNRDARFYENIFYNGSQLRRFSNSQLMYTFNTAEGGNDAPGGSQVSPTGYYIRKFLWLGWNPFDAKPDTGYRCNYLLRWTRTCLVFAEAANILGGPMVEKYGYTAKQALSWLRTRANALSFDAYLETVSASNEDFLNLVKNEWRIETCFEGDRYFNLRRWARDASELDMELHGVKIRQGFSGGSDMEYDYTTVVEQLEYPSLWSPLPYMEIRRCPNMVQNEGWETWR